MLRSYWYGKNRSFLHGVLAAVVLFGGANQFACAEDAKGLTPSLQALLNRIPNDESVMTPGGRKNVEERLTACNGNINAVPQYGQPLILDVVGYSSKPLEMVKLFVEYGADLKATGRGRVTLLHVAAASYNETEKIPLMTFLLEKGLNVNAKDEDGCTPLHGATDAATIRFLLKNKAEVNAKDNVGWTPLDYADTMRENQLIRALRQAGGTCFPRSRRPPNERMPQ